jgi:hypothetical protein
LFLKIFICLCESVYIHIGDHAGWELELPVTHTFKMTSLISYFCIPLPFSFARCFCFPLLSFFFHFLFTAVLLLLFLLSFSPSSAFLSSFIIFVFSHPSGSFYSLLYHIIFIIIFLFSILPHSSSLFRPLCSSFCFMQYAGDLIPLIVSSVFFSFSVYNPRSLYENTFLLPLATFEKQTRSFLRNSGNPAASIYACWTYS